MREFESLLDQLENYLHEAGVRLTSFSPQRTHYEMREPNGWWIVATRSWGPLGGALEFRKPIPHKVRALIEAHASLAGAPWEGARGGDGAIGLPEEAASAASYMDKVLASYPTLLD
jgi:hypothetical protein